MFDFLFDSESRAFIQNILVYALMAVALLWGAGPERAAIGIWWGFFELPSLVYRHMLGYDVRVTDIDYFMASIDVTAGALWIVLALYANRNYTLWIAGVQLLAIGSHAARGMVEAISPIGYLFLVIVPGWLQLCIISIGFARHILRKRKYGKYRDWRITRRPPANGRFLAPGDVS